MRSFECYVDFFNKEGELVHASHHACWSMMRHRDIGEKVYIYQFDEEDTKRYQRLLVALINKITPCRLINKPPSSKPKSFRQLIINKFRRPLFSRWNESRIYEEPVKRYASKYIEFQLLNSYDESLVLLNFIRNLWHEPMGYAGYGLKFFKALRESRKVHKDPMARLTWANKEALNSMGNRIYGSPGHSNVHVPSVLKVRTTEEFRAIFKSITGPKPDYYGGTRKFLTDG